MGAGIERSAIVIARFPYTNLSQFVNRPTLVLAYAGRRDWLLGYEGRDSCPSDRGRPGHPQLTTNEDVDDLAIELTNDSLSVGSLLEVSYFRPNKLFTGNQSLIIRPVARLKPEVFNRLLDATMDILDSNRMK